MPPEPAFVVEEPLLAFEAAGVAGEGAVGADDAVAGDEDGDGIGGVGPGDGPQGRGAADGAGDVGV